MTRLRALPRVALTLGDPSGIGPEICLAAASDPRVIASMQLVLIGPACFRPPAIALVAAEDEEPRGWIESPTQGEWSMGRAQREGGLAARAALRIGHELARLRRVDALVTAPVSKEALHLAGERVEGQTELLGRWCEARRFEMLAIAGRLRVMLLTRHMPLRQAIDSVDTPRVLDRLQLFDESLKRLGIGAPRLALAGLNPHAGEHGVLGREEEELLAPAVQAARAAGLDVHGPLPPDSVFLQASRGEFDGVLALYHDQAFIPIKLLSQDGGVTLVAGLPYLRVSPVHGTAFDIAGRGIASPANLVSALLQAAAWVRERA